MNSEHSINIKFYNLGENFGETPVLFKSLTYIAKTMYKNILYKKFTSKFLQAVVLT